MHAENQEKKRTAKNLFYSAISTSSMVFLFLILLAVGRYLGEEQFGIFNTALAIATIAEMLADFGLRDLCLRDVARQRDKTSLYLGNLLTWKVVLSCCVFLVMVAAVYVLHYEAAVRRIVFILIAASLAKSMKYTLRLFLQANDRFGLDAAIEGGEKVVLFIAAVITLALWRDLDIFVAVYCGLRLLGPLVIIWVLNVSVAPVRPRFDFRFSARLQAAALPFGLFAVVFVLLSYVDTIMLSRLRDYSEVGLYNAAFRVYEGITIVPSIFFLVMLPRLSRLYKADREAHYRLGKRVVAYMYIIAVPLFMVGFLLSSFLVTLFGGDYFPAATALRILLFGVLFSFPTWMLNTILISIDKQKVMLLIAVIGTVANIIMNFAVIPLWGYNGSALATAASEVIMFAAILAYLARHDLTIPVLRQAWRPLLGGGLLLAVGVMLRIKNIGTLAVVSVIFLTAYFIYIYMTGILKKDEKEIIRSVFTGLGDRIRRSRA